MIQFKLFHSGEAAYINPENVSYVIDATEAMSGMAKDYSGDVTLIQFNEGVSCYVRFDVEGAAFRISHGK